MQCSLRDLRKHFFCFLLFVKPRHTIPRHDSLRELTERLSSLFQRSLPSAPLLILQLQPPLNLTFLDLFYYSPRSTISSLLDPLPTYLLKKHLSVLTPSIPRLINALLSKTISDEPEIRFSINSRVINKTPDL